MKRMDMQHSYRTFFQEYIEITIKLILYFCG